MALEYKKMSLFDAPKGSLLVHACNAKGVWGRGIAKEFKDRYPHAYDNYKQHCDVHNSDFMKKYVVGSANAPIWPNDPHRVGWIITSNGYAEETDSPEDIKVATTLALEALCRQLEPEVYTTVYSNKFNSGLFRVPWEDSERILKKVLSRYQYIQWVVCDPDLK